MSKEPRFGEIESSQVSKFYLTLTDAILATQHGHMLAYYPCTDAVGSTTFKDLKGGNSAVATNVTFGGAGVISGETSASFNGASSVLTLPAAIKSSFNGNSGTLMMFVKLATGTWEDATVDGWFFFRVDANNYLLGQKGGTGAIIIRHVGSGGLPCDQYNTVSIRSDWVQVAFSWSKAQNRAQIRVDGHNTWLPGTGVSTWVGSPLVDAYIGYNMSTYFNGSMAHVTLWDVELNDAELVAIRDSYKVATPASGTILPSVTTFSVALLSDLHPFRMSNSYTTSGSMQDALEHIRVAHNPCALVVTGDVSEESSITEYRYYERARDTAFNIPLYEVLGNHDEGYGLDPVGNSAQVATYQEWDQSFPNQRHWAFTQGDYRFIGVPTRMIRYPYVGQGYMGIDTDELTWTHAQLDALAGKKPVVFLHCPVTNTLGGLYGASQVAFTALLVDHGVKLTCFGHKHMGPLQANQTEVVAGQTYFHATSLAYSAGDADPNIGGYTIMNFTPVQCSLDIYYGRYPFNFCKNVVVAM